MRTFRSLQNPQPRRKFFRKALGLSVLGSLFAPFSALGRSTKSSDFVGIEPFIGEIAMFGFNFAPQGWAKCDGQLLSISSNSALFSLLGTTYGGDGETTFGLPDLRSRVPMHQGNGPGLSNRVIGQKLGAETTTLTTNQIPSHSHTAVMRALDDDGSSNNAAGNVLANATAQHFSSQAPDENMAAGSVVVSNAGGGQSHNNMPPCLVINFCIALVGIFPSP